MTQHIFDEDYTGERWTYGLVYRPFLLGTVPPGSIIGSLDETDTRCRFGTIQYPFELTEQQISSYQLEVIHEDPQETTHPQG